MIEKILPYLIAFAGALALTFVLTPIVREANRRLGMVDKPDPRRINKVPIPRGGGLAIVLGVLVSYGVFIAVSGRPALGGCAPGLFGKMVTLSLAVAALGLADDRFSLRPVVKLLGQLVIAFLVWWWADLGFNDLWTSLPPWLDCLMTVFWIVGAVNAFNLIDGLDGLATGLALIAVMGMAGGVFFTRAPGETLFYFALMGGFLGFLYYNYNPASVFLGDCGSMFIGFVVSTLPLQSHVPNSFLVSIGVPLLAMGVPIFDTTLAILRRTVRRVLLKRLPSESVGNDRVMTADADHLHHRILRSVGMSQRRAAWTLYAMAAAAVLVGMGGLLFSSRAAGIWVFALAVASVVVFRDMAPVELYDVGRLLNSVAHNRNRDSRRRWSRLSVPFFVAADLTILIGAFFLTVFILDIPITRTSLRAALPLRTVPVFLLLILFRSYRTVWSRAMGSNYVRLFAACLLGALFGSAFVYYAPTIPTEDIFSFSVCFGLVSFFGMIFLRTARGVVRDLFYAIDCSRLRGRKDVSRVLVYGAGLRYRTFRRELVRKTSANDRIIVGIIDDDLTLRGKRIGGIRIMGTLSQAAEIVNETNADAVVVACEISDEWLRVVKDILAPTGVKVSVFSFSERIV